MDTWRIEVCDLTPSQKKTDLMHAHAPHIISQCTCKHMGLHGREWRRMDALMRELHVPAWATCFCTGCMGRMEHLGYKHKCTRGLHGVAWGTWAT